MRQKFKIAGWVAIGALTGALTTVSLQTAARANMAPLPLEELQQLAAVFSMVKSDYVEPVDEKKLISDAITGMVASLDPHSQYYDKKSFKEFREGTTGRFVGVGIEITQEEGLIKIVSPIEGSPAFRGGIKSGDMITKIDDTAVKGLSLNDAVKRMRGEPNTKVQLTIFRKDENRSFPVTITRQEIKTQSVKAKLIELTNALTKHITSAGSTSGSTAGGTGGGVAAVQGALRRLPRQQRLRRRRCPDPGTGRPARAVPAPALRAPPSGPADASGARRRPAGRGVAARPLGSPLSGERATGPACAAGGARRSCRAS